jgi:hypothetical protein
MSAQVAPPRPVPPKRRRHDALPVGGSTFDNGSNNHQNNLRISAGVVVRF